jgi:hypothetical protein
MQENFILFGQERLFPNFTDQKGVAMLNLGVYLYLVYELGLVFP